MHPKLKNVQEAALCLLIQYEQPLALLGLYYLTNNVFHGLITFLSACRHYVLAQWFPPNLRCYGQWAVVMVEENTISYYYAEELARKRMDVLLLGQEEDSGCLEGLATNLQRKYKVQTRVLLLSNDCVNLLECIRNELNALSSIGILVNQLPSRPRFELHTQRTDCDITMTIQTLLQTNHITKIVANMMMERGGGAIVNISDPSADHPEPYLANYSAAAAYMDVFSLSLRREVACYNVHVQSLVANTFTKIPQDSNGSCSLGLFGPRDMARHAVNSIGKVKSRGSWWYAVKGYIASCVPLCLRQSWRSRVNVPPGKCVLPIEEVD